VGFAKGTNLSYLRSANFLISHDRRKFDNFFVTFIISRQKFFVQFFNIISDAVLNTRLNLN